MLPPTPPRRARLRRLTVTLAVAAAGTLAVAAPASATNPVTPGNFTGYGFDQCEAPSQAAMTAWRAHSSYRGVGIYVSGSSRACKTQRNLTATWVANQLAAGWHLLPITLGPQASCSTRFPRYGWSVDPTINPSTTNSYAAARTQGRATAQQAVTAAANLGIVKGSTLFYDLESFSLTKSTACTWSALWFLNAWTHQLHSLGYASGYYSSGSTGIKMIDDARVRAGNPIAMPDQLWIADWNGQANTASTYVRTDGWQPHARVHQYRGGHNETHGGVTINIDSNWLDLRTPLLGGTPPPPPPPPPPPSGPPATTGTADPACTRASISKPAYTTTSATTGGTLVTALQCVLKQQGFYNFKVTGTWNAPTLSGLQGYQAKKHHPVRHWASPSDWTSLLSAGNSRTTLRAGAGNADVIRVQRALNAATHAKLPVSGRYDAATVAAVKTYQHQVGLNRTGVVGSAVWWRLEAGKL